MRYLLDTCVISDFVKGEPNTQTRLRQTPPAEIAVSTITVMELRYGLQFNPQRAANIEPIITSLLSSVTLLPFGTAEAGQAAQYSQPAETNGTTDRSLRRSDWSNCPAK